MMTPAQAAIELGISGRQLRDLTADGAIPYIDVGRGKREARRYEPSDIEAFKAERRRIAGPPVSRLGQRHTAKPPAHRVYDIQEILAKRQSERLKQSSEKRAARKAKADSSKTGQVSSRRVERPMRAGA